MFYARLCICVQAWTDQYMPSSMLLVLLAVVMLPTVKGKNPKWHVTDYCQTVSDEPDTPAYTCYDKYNKGYLSPPAGSRSMLYKDSNYILDFFSGQGPNYAYYQGAEFGKTTGVHTYAECHQSCQTMLGANKKDASYLKKGGSMCVAYTYMPSTQTCYYYNSFCNGNIDSDLTGIPCGFAKIDPCPPAAGDGPQSGTMSSADIKYRIKHGGTYSDLNWKPSLANWPMLTYTPAPTPAPTPVPTPAPTPVPPTVATTTVTTGSGSTTTATSTTSTTTTTTPYTVCPAGHYHRDTSPVNRTFTMSDGLLQMDTADTVAFGDTIRFDTKKKRRRTPYALPYNHESDRHAYFQSCCNGHCTPE